jgi:hypothetical protein
VPPRRTLAVFTLVRDEAIFLPLWLRHYKKQVPASDIYVLDNDTVDGSTDGLDVTVRRVPNDGIVDHDFHVRAVMAMQRELLQRYQYVLFTDADELVCVDPRRYRSLADYVNRKQPVVVRALSWEPVELAGEAPIDWSAPILAQRSRWKRSVVNGMTMNKPLLASVPVNWCPGFHHDLDRPELCPDPALLLVHLHRVDYRVTQARHRRKSGYTWSEHCLAEGLGWHNRISEGPAFDEWYYRDEAGWEPIPEELKRLV